MLSKIFLRVLKHIYDNNFLETYQELVPALQKLDKSIADRSFVIALNKYHNFGQHGKHGQVH